MSAAPLRVLVCGGRDYRDRDHIFGALDELHADTPIGCIIEGGCPTGADNEACWWAFHRRVKAIRFEAKWNLEGHAAGPLRNARMLAEGKPDLVIAFPGGRGTADMVRKARAAGVPIREIASPTPSAAPGRPVA